VLDDDGFVASTGGTVAPVDAGATSGSAALLAGAPGPTLAAEPIVLDCAPPLLCTSPLRGSSVTVDPIDVDPVMLVELVGAGAEVDTPTEKALDGGPSAPAAAGGEEPPSAAEDVVPVDGVVPVDVVPVDEVAPVDEVRPVDGVPPVDVVRVDEVAPVDDESVAGEPESVGSAHATPGVVATAIPTPNAAANPPTRPMYLARPMNSLANRGYAEMTV
jgi:hypothetical protein